ncbi:MULTISPECIES: hypothetical protein [unclassified Flavobacterium]|uniref:hypothetical protein n=1 Tax=unclassified Flavobacterium TaxID=196869 RepID=UPI0025BB59D4|nr:MULTISPECIES: hypothetical protein [unclassified Flavobacterium]
MPHNRQRLFRMAMAGSKRKQKQKYEIGLPNEELFAFAGLYSHWVDKTREN